MHHTVTLQDSRTGLNDPAGCVTTSHPATAVDLQAERNEPAAILGSLVTTQPESYEFFFFRYHHVGDKETSALHAGGPVGHGQPVSLQDRGSCLAPTSSQRCPQEHTAQIAQHNVITNA